MGVAEDASVKQTILTSPYHTKYSLVVDSDSAYEVLARTAKQEALKVQEQMQEGKKASSTGRQKKSALERATDSAVSAVGRELGRSLTRGLLGSLKKLF